MRTYGILDLALAALYAWVGLSVAPSRSPAFNVALGVTIALCVVSGASLVARARWARLVGIVTAAALLAFAAFLVAGLVASSAYVRGIYGPLGRGVAVLALCAAALVIELFALVPFFQLRFLLKQK
jgi:hypothetical protein